jgi:hypothetical protein
MAGPLELKAAVMDARMAESDRIDLSAGVAKAQQGRLNQLSELLTAVRSDIPEGDDRFSLAVLPGATPRLWVDPTSFVMLSDDTRTYRCVKDTRGGRRALAESTNTADIAEQITRYVARRIVEREREIEADFIAGGETAAALVAPEVPKSRFLMGLVVGALAAAGGLFGWAWFGGSPL